MRTHTRFVFRSLSLSSSVRIGGGEKVKAEQIALDISIALICTAMGLMTAIPFTYLLANLNIRVRNLQDSLSSGMTRFLEHFKTVTARYL